MINYIDTPVPANRIALKVELKSCGAIQFSDSEEDTGWLYHLSVNDEWADYYVLYVGGVDANYLPVIRYPENIDALPVRIDSGCITGMTFGDKSCECKQQLDEAIRLIRETGSGFVIHIPAQDGRGMGIDFKLQTLRKQHILGFDTVKAARATAGTDLIDRRTYHGATVCLKFLGIQPDHKINIATNNPNKIASFVEGGFCNFSETRIHIPPTKFTKRHLAAKKKHLKHLL